MKFENSKFHFIGIGGIGMCGLAELLKNMGAQVSGSDMAENANTERLKKMGIPIFKGHAEKNISDVDVVVYSSAVPKTNPEMLEAKRRKIPLIQRGECLAEIMRYKRGIAVAGTHGKTTTTSMVASIFMHAKAEPTIFVGGRIEKLQSTALFGKGEWLIAEADESDGSFHMLTPELTIITNIDSDHLDYFKNFENLQKNFLAFAQKVPFYGASVVCGDDPKTKELFAHFSKRIIFYGFEPANDYVIKGEAGRYEISKAGKSLGSFQLSVPGKHNALNATAALIVGLQAGFSFATCVEGLAQFDGVDRRFQFKGEAKKIRVYDDYGHHPTEVRATLQAFKEKYPKNRVVVFFQPHRYSRTQSCWSDFTKCFAQADVLLLTDIYSAGEAPIDGIDSQKLAMEIKNSHYLPKSEQLAEAVLAQLKAEDVLVTLGAGDGWKIGMQVLEKLKI